ncbi:poly-gamma-glutamate hydrolase family protein [Marinococcus sp. PL1-022]|uniref:poly-gamma-glutamate hydrolase family protein n=1 Tax=Marinococcus sp. PL1-022 TaxID=3095363 RepID=UPI0029C5342C|nr:poly-gamma-glutamate hydrolase family protein [Marinococcus sp. PL1-022]MDX6151419.1 poly-gamma-glutamate hydrolase family protein [Marinococcus sp. PL1-022]
MRKKYADYAELNAGELEGRDYDIRVLLGSHRTLVALAPHGGAIEAGTSELVEELHRSCHFSAYDFHAKKRTGNRRLHIRSTCFDEPRALSLAAEALFTVTLHGYRGEERKTYIGGLDTSTADLIGAELAASGFSVDFEPPSAIEGKYKGNICNKNRRKQGVQLEISSAQRRAFFANEDLSSANRGNRLSSFYEYAGAIGRALRRAETTVCVTEMQMSE